MSAAGLSDWAAFLSLSVALSAAAAIPFVGWVDADYLFVADWQVVGDRLLVEVVRAKGTVRTVPVTATALLMLLSPAALEGAR